MIKGSHICGMIINNTNLQNKVMYKLNNKILIALFTMIMLLVSCKKNNEDFNPNENEIIDSKGILLATRNIQNGEIYYNYDLEELNYSLHKRSNTSEYKDFILESMFIIDTLPISKTTHAEIKISVINTEKEESFTIWLMDNFIIKDVKEEYVEYFLSKNVKEGNYTMGTWGNNKTYIGTVYNDSLTIETIDGLCYAPRVPKWTISCKPTNCMKGCDKTKIDNHYWRCSNCEPGQENAKCEQGESWLLSFLKELVSIF